MTSIVKQRPDVQHQTRHPSNSTLTHVSLLSCPESGRILPSPWRSYAPPHPRPGASRAPSPSLRAPSQPGPGEQSPPRESAWPPQCEISLQRRMRESIYTCIHGCARCSLRLYDMSALCPAKTLNPEYLLLGHLVVHHARSVRASNGTWHHAVWSPCLLDSVRRRRSVTNLGERRETHFKEVVRVEK
jgi:hypothetical protein